MFTLDHPWLLLLLPLPLVIRFVLPSYRESAVAIRIPWFNRVAALFNINPDKGTALHKTGIFGHLVNGIFWFMIVIGLTRPQYLDDPITRVVPTRDLLLIVDLSGSMETVDFTSANEEKVDRLTAVKEVLDNFLTRREGDRVGLIVFGNAPFVQVPFTQDLEACRLLLGETAPRMAGPRTSFGDAIGLGITMFEQSDVEDKVMIALTDGNDTGSKVPPSEAAKIARDKDIVIHVVGVGDPAAAGEEKLDEQTLETVASQTGGSYFFAADRERLEGIYAAVDKIGTREVEMQSYRPRYDLYHYPLGVFMVMSLLYHMIMILIRHRQSPGENANG